MTKRTSQVEPPGQGLRLPEKMPPTPNLGVPGAGSFPPGPLRQGQRLEFSSPRGRRAGKCKGCACCNSGGKVLALPPSLRSPEPLYTKQPPRPGLDFREAVSEEAAARDFSMRFQVKSTAFQFCQETSPLSLSGCLPPGSQAVGPCLPDAHPHLPPPPVSPPMPSTLSPPVPHPLQLRLRRRPWRRSREGSNSLDCSAGPALS